LKRTSEEAAVEAFAAASALTVQWAFDTNALQQNNGVTRVIHGCNQCSKNTTSEIAT
jgi:hypothetical protein